MAPQEATAGHVANRPFTCRVESIKLLFRICPYPETPPKRRQKQCQEKWNPVFRPTLREFKEPRA
jgi:hypothetical protein